MVIKIPIALAGIRSVTDHREQEQQDDHWFKFKIRKHVRHLYLYTARRVLYMCITNPDDALNYADESLIYAAESLWNNLGTHSYILNLNDL